MPVLDDSASRRAAEHARSESRQMEIMAMLQSLLEACEREAQISNDNRSQVQQHLDQLTLAIANASAAQTQNSAQIQDVAASLAFVLAHINRLNVTTNQHHASDPVGLQVSAENLASMNSNTMSGNNSRSSTLRTRSSNIEATLPPRAALPFTDRPSTAAPRLPLRTLPQQMRKQPAAMALPISQPPSSSLSMSPPAAPKSARPQLSVDVSFRQKTAPREGAHPVCGGMPR